MHSIFGALILLAVGMRGQELPSAALEYGAYGFPDSSGTRILSTAHLAQPGLLRTALCSSGIRVPVRFERHQAGAATPNPRELPENFDLTAGDVFRLVTGRIEIVGASCFLASEQLLSTSTALPVERLLEHAECDASLRRRIAASRSRPVAHCWALAGLPGNRRLLLVEFARRDKDALASIALADGTRLIFADYPAVFRGEAEDVWRAGDGGVLSADGFEIVFLLRRGASYVLGVNWSGPEGASLGVFVSNGENRFTRVISDYWYRAPF